MLFARHWNRSAIEDLLNFIDWLMSLPVALEDRFDVEWDELERIQTMAQTGSPIMLRAEARGERRGAQQATRDKLLKVLDQRFGPTPENIRARIEQIQDITELDRLFDEALTAESRNDMHLPEERRA